MLAQSRGTFARVLVWALALTLAIFSARYFLVPAPLLRVPVPFAEGPIVDAVQDIAPYLYANHPFLLLPHIAAGIVALVIGLFQFLPGLRASRPALHRAMGRVYVAAVFGGSIVGLPLSLMVLDGLPEPMRAQFSPVVAGFVSLSIVWPCLAALAWRRAWQRRFDDHRAWMMRSYSLTFAAVTTRLVGPVFFAVTGDFVVSVNLAILSWPLNLVVAEILIRRRAVARTAGALATRPA